MNKHLLSCFIRRSIQIFCIGFIFLIPVRSFGQAQIDSVKTTVSTCAQNGSITIFAKSPSNPFLVYSITAGSITEPAQTNNVFTSLPSGSYTVQVSDGTTNATQTATIGGNYLPLNFNPTNTSPYCVGSTDGQIIGNRTSGTGTAPFT
jgi:hypothetical protein